METDMRVKGIQYVFALFTLAALLFLNANVGQAASKEPIKVKVGTSISVAKTKAYYRSTDKSIAYVDADGLVTAKKRGKATIKIIKDGKITNQPIKVVKNGCKKDYVDVSSGEIKVIQNETILQPTETGIGYEVKLVLKNEGTATPKKVILTGKVGDKTLTFRVTNLAAGKKTTLTATGTTESESVDGEVLLQTLSVYSRKMITIYDYNTQKTSYDWGTKDKTAPVFEGFVEENSYNQNMPYMLVYSDDKDYDYFKYVKAVDDRGGKVKLNVNTKKVNFKKNGVYKIKYTAKDEAGNVAKTWAKLEVRKPTNLDKYADELLKTIIKKDSWSDLRKLTAIYNYTRGHISYTGYSDKSSWEKEAVRGIKNGKGDCFTFYSIARALLTRAGYPNIEITRYRGAGHHWWNMVYVYDGWYHYDCCPRTGGGRFCLLTDEQLTKYSKSHGDIFIWNYDIMPKTPKKKLTTVFKTGY